MTNTIRLAISPTVGTLKPQDIESLVLEIKDEVEQSDTFGISLSETQQKNKGTLGPEWLPVLTAVLSAPVATLAVKGLIITLQDWLRRRKPVTITIEGPKGNYTITSVNMSGEEIERVVTKIV